LTICRRKEEEKEEEEYVDMFSFGSSLELNAAAH
jgi:hypothetical protein